MVCVWLGVGVCVCSVLSNSSCGSVVVVVLAMFISSQESYVDRIYGAMEVTWRMAN